MTTSGDGPRVPISGSGSGLFKSDSGEFQAVVIPYGTSQARKDGNHAALAALNNAGEMRELTRRYIESSEAIDLATAIAPFGLRIEAGGFRTRISGASDLSGAQRDLLRKFGYNEKLDGTHGRRARAH